MKARVMQPEETKNIVFGKTATVFTYVMPNTAGPMICELENDLFQHQIEYENKANPTS